MIWRDGSNIVGQITDPLEDSVASQFPGGCRPLGRLGVRIEGVYPPANTYATLMPQGCYVNVATETT